MKVERLTTGHGHDWENAYHALAAELARERERTTALTEALREEFFRLLPELDYETEGGTWDEPRWGWYDHPWKGLLGITNDECVAALAASSPADTQDET